MSLLGHHTTVFLNSPPTNTEVLSPQILPEEWHTYSAVRAYIIALRTDGLPDSTRQVARVIEAARGRGIRRSDLCRYIAGEKREDLFRRSIKLRRPLDKEEWIAFERGDLSLSTLSTREVLPSPLLLRDPEPLGNHREPQIEHELFDAGTRYDTNSKPNVVISEEHSKHTACARESEQARDDAMLECSVQAQNDETPWPDEAVAPTSEPQEPATLVAEMVALGMDPIIAALTARKYPEEHIRRQIQVVNVRPNVRNRGAYLLTAIRNDFAVDVPKPGSEYEQAYLAERKIPEMPTAPPEDQETRRAAARRRIEAEEAEKRKAEEARALARRNDPKAQARDAEARAKAMASIREKLAKVAEKPMPRPQRAPEVARMPQPLPPPPPAAADGLASMRSLMARMRSQPQAVAA